MSYPYTYLRPDRTQDPEDQADLFPAGKPLENIPGLPRIPQYYDTQEQSDLFPSERPLLPLSGAARSARVAASADPFARRKRELKALGYSEDDISVLDRGLEALRALPQDQRQKTFEGAMDRLEQMGFTDDQIEAAKNYLNVGEGQIPEPIPTALQEAARKAGGAAAVLRPAFSLEGYKRFVHKPLTKLGEKGREQLRRGVAAVRRSPVGVYLPSTDEVKEVIEARNWRKLDQWADQGRMPTFDEMGPEYFEQLMATLAQEYNPVQLRASQSILAQTFTHPSSSWLRRGEIPNIIPQSAVEKMWVRPTGPAPIRALKKAAIVGGLVITPL